MTNSPTDNPKSATQVLTEVRAFMNSLGLTPYTGDPSPDLREGEMSFAWDSNDFKVRYGASVIYRISGVYLFKETSEGLREHFWEEGDFHKGIPWALEQVEQSLVLSEEMLTSSWLNDIEPVTREGEDVTVQSVDPERGGNSVPLPFCKIGVGEVKTLIWHDGPVILVYHRPNGEKVLQVFVEHLEEANPFGEILRYIFTKVTQEQVDDFKSGKCDIKSLFEGSLEQYWDEIYVEQAIWHRLVPIPAEDVSDLLPDDWYLTGPQEES